MEYRIIRSSRKTISLEVTPAGEVVVRCPNRLPAREVQNFVESQQEWIRSHLQKVAQQPAAPRMSREELRSLGQKAVEAVPGRVSHFAEKLGVTYGRITIRAQRTKWGSCSSIGNLNFNCLLMLAPPEVLDYIVVHELCHRKEMNHSARFWQEVERVMPDYRIHKKWLDDNGSALMARLPD